jgi:hypothetical protein
MVAPSLYRVLYLVCTQRQAVRTVIPTPEPNRWSVLCSHLAASRSGLPLLAVGAPGLPEHRAGGSPITVYLGRTYRFADLPLTPCSINII